MSSIKQKIGKCIDCPTDAAEQPLIAKRCQSHYWANRRQVRGSTGKINIKSDKQLEREIQYAKARKAWILNRKICEANIFGICKGGATEVHHMAGRIGPLLLDTTTWLAVCHYCHRWITDNSADAIMLGLSLRRNN